MSRERFRILFVQGGWLAALAMFVLFVVLPGGRAADEGDPQPIDRPAGVESPARSAADELTLATRRTPVVDVFERSRDAVVNISSTEIVKVGRSFGIESLFDDLFDLPSRQRELRRQSVGSGFVIHPRGYIVTNAHVVARTAERKVAFADGREYEARIVAADTSRDLAILKIDTEEDLPTLPLGRSYDLMIGETVIAIGNPLGYQHTVTAGVVSALDRDLEFNRNLALRQLVQTDASINPGNSGGPLLNVLGELIGINTAIRGDAQNIGFAIPVDQLREVLPDLLDIRRRYRIDAGLDVSTLDEPRVIRVQPQSPAERAGIQVGDVIAEIDGLPVNHGLDFHIGLIGKRPGQPLRLLLDRDGRRLEQTLRLAELPAPDGAELARTRLGIEIYPLPEDVARDLRLPGSAGLLVSRVEPGGPADRLGLQRRDVLLAIGRYYVSSVDDLGQILEDVKTGDDVTVAVLRVDRYGKARLSGNLVAR